MINPELEFPRPVRIRHIYRSPQFRDLRVATGNVVSYEGVEWITRGMLIGVSRENCGFVYNVRFQDGGVHELHEHYLEETSPLELLAGAAESSDQLQLDA